MLMTEERPVATAILLERRRLQQLFARAKRADGTYDENALQRFEDALCGGEPD